MAVDNHFHQGVLVGRSAAKARYIGYSQHQLGRAVGHGLPPVNV